MKPGEDHTSCVWGTWLTVTTQQVSQLGCNTRQLIHLSSPGPCHLQSYLRHTSTHTYLWHVTCTHTAEEIDLSAVTSGLVSKFRKRDSSYRKTTTTKNKRVLTAVKRSCRFVSHCCSVNRTCLIVRNPACVEVAVLSRVVWIWLEPVKTSFRSLLLFVFIPVCVSWKRNINVFNFKVLQRLWGNGVTCEWASLVLESDLLYCC